MKSGRLGKKVIWAIDPFEEPFQAKRQLLKTLKEISKRQETIVEPVHVLDFSLERDKSFEMAQNRYENYKRAATLAIQEIIKGISGIHFLAPHILMLEDSSPGEMAKSLIDYATKSQAGLIVAGTHGRHGLSRLFLGSFAETLLLHSQLPIVTIGPECLNPANWNKVLFATDFGENSLETFRKLLKFAQASNLKITLFHIIRHELDPVLQSGIYLLGGGWVSIPDYLSDQENQKRKLAEEWVREAHESCVTTHIHFDSSGGSIVDSILEYAKKHNYDWIAMAAEGGLVKSTMTGSIVRQVVRHAPCPVWVARNSKIQMDKKERPAS